MSISTVSSTSSPVMMEKNLRRVRFSLPEAKLQNNKRAVHGTSMYVNGTLINMTSAVHSADKKLNSKFEGNNVNILKPNSKALTIDENIPGEPSKYKAQTFSIKSVPSVTESPHASISNTPVVISRRKVNKASNNRHYSNTLPSVERKASSVEDFDWRNEKLKTVTLNKYQSSDDLRDESKFTIIPNSKNVTLFPFNEALSHYKAFKHSSSNSLKVPDFNESK